MNRKHILQLPKLQFQFFDSTGIPVYKVGSRLELLHTVKSRELLFSVRSQHKTSRLKQCVRQYSCQK